MNASKRLLLGPPGDPRQIDICEPNSKGWSRSGIFRITGDTMLLSVGDPRPTDFRDVADGREVLKLRRVSAVGK